MTCFNAIERLRTPKGQEISVLLFRGRSATWEGEKHLKLVPTDVNLSELPQKAWLCTGRGLPLDGKRENDRAAQKTLK